MAAEASTNRRGAGPRWLPAALVAGWVLLATALQLMRSAGVPAWDTVWAEDGGYFLSTALQDPLGSVLSPLSGYLQVPSRIFGSVAAGLPLDWASEVFAVGPALVVSLLSIYVFVAGSTLLRSPVPRMLLAAALVLLPSAVIESTANAANLQYFLLFASFWALIHEPRNAGELTAACAIVAAAALNTVLAWLFVPLAVYAWRGSSSRRRLVVMAFAAGVVVQAIGVFAAIGLDTDPTLKQYPITWAPSDPLELPGIYAVRVIAALFLGIRPLDAAWAALGWGMVLILVAVVAAVLATGVRRNGSTRAWILVATGYSAACFAVPVLLRGTEHLPTEGADFLIAGARYTLAPIWFLMSAVVLVLWESGDSSGGWRRIARAAFVAVLATSAIASFRIGTFRSEGPPWSAALEDARRDCGLGDVDSVTIPITPDGWSLSASCQAIRR